MSSVRAMSYGGGVQSTAMLVLAAEGRIDYPLALFANVGADSENPATLAYVEDVARPFAERAGIELVTLQRRRRNGEPDTLMAQIERQRRSIPIPMRMSGNGAPGNRSCTGDFKIAVVAKELKARGATADDPATVALGISLDEYQRMRSESGIAHQRLAYPLIDLRMDRQACINVITDAGLPVPPKSSCYFCPFHSLAMWRELRRESPELFARAADLEARMNARRAELGKDEVWLTTALRPLADAIQDTGQLDLFAPACDIGGYCHA